MAFERLGFDLRLLGDLTHQDDRHRGSDLRTQLVAGLRDLDTLTRVENFKQALLLRFMTHVGEMAVLGHADYGSRLFQLIGELNNDTNRSLAKLYTLEALEAEPRVREVVSVDVTQDPGDPTRADISVRVTPIDTNTPVNLVFPFFFEGGGSQ
jgi:ABC-type hemin transport system substrate-binding protein